VESRRAGIARQTRGVANGHDPEQIIMDLPSRLKDQWSQLFAAHPEVKRAIVFGSRARSDAEKRSDVDLAIEAPEATARQWLDLWYSLKEESDTLLVVDVVRLEEASAELRHEILSEGEVLYERKQDRPKPG